MRVRVEVRATQREITALELGTGALVASHRRSFAKHLNRIGFGRADPADLVAGIDPGTSLVARLPSKTGRGLPMRDTWRLSSIASEA
jgi:hypothetical protein